MAPGILFPFLTARFKTEGPQVKTMLNTRNEMPVRYRAARADGTIGSLERRMEEMFDLPTGSVKIVRPDGRKVRTDAKVKTLRDQWE